MVKTGSSNDSSAATQIEMKEDCQVNNANGVIDIAHFSAALYRNSIVSQHS